jgi:hypothetical protein
MGKGSRMQMQADRLASVGARMRAGVHAASSPGDPEPPEERRARTEICRY